MVLEFLLGYEQKKPLQLFCTGFFFSSVAVFVSVVLFFHSPSMVIVTFMTLPLVYIFTQIMKTKSLENVKTKTIKDIFRVNSDIVEMYLSVFMGMVMGIAVWYSVLPSQLTDLIFSEQIWNLQAITTLAVASAASSSKFWTIAINNAKLVLLCSALSFVFAAGALFILSWNASIVGVAIGSIVRMLGSGPKAVVEGLSLGILFYIPHLVPEVIAYFTAAIAGALISSAMLRYRPFGEKSQKLIGVALILVALSLALIMLAAAIEVNISHIIQAAYR